MFFAIEINRETELNPDDSQAGSSQQVATE
jgi:hypothetical protein